MKRKMLVSGSLSALLLLAGALNAQVGGTIGFAAPAALDSGASPTPTNAGCSPGNIAFHTGGAIVTGVFRIYSIYYGPWVASDRQILVDLIGNLGGTGYWNINTTYTQAGGAHVTNAVSGGAKTIYDPAESVGSQMDGATMRAYLTNLFNTKQLPVDTNGLYTFFLTPDVGDDNDGFCSGGSNDFCAYHTYYTYNGKAIKYAIVPSPLHCSSTYGTASTNGVAHCAAANIANSPNSSPAVDAMASAFTHEAEETATDPLINAWLDNCGNESSDKCAYNYGATGAAVNGTTFNLQLGARQYLIQQQYSNVSQSCKLTYP
jgi:hypothetical protein